MSWNFFPTSTRPELAPNCSRLLLLRVIHVAPPLLPGDNQAAVTEIGLEKSEVDNFVEYTETLTETEDGRLISLALRRMGSNEQ